MQLHTLIFELIDMRSFSNLWYWIALAVVWSSASHWVLGVPYDMVLRARRRGGQLETDLEDLVRINVNRILFVTEVSGMWLVGLSTAFLSMLAVLGFQFGIEFCQAVFLLAFPISIVSLLSVRRARLIAAGPGHGQPLYSQLRRHRMTIQLIGILAIFVTALWGMWRNLNASALWG